MAGFWRHCRRVPIMAVVGVFAGAMLCLPLNAQQDDSCFVLPFENRSSNSNLDWMGESFVESLATALQDAGLTVLSRQERAAAFDQAGIPLLPTLSLATRMRIADDADAHWLIFGAYRYDGQIFRVTATLVDLQREHLLDLPAEQGALQDIESIQDHLAQSVVQAIHPDFAVASLPTRQHVLLPAYENYIRGVIATEPRLRLKYLREAVRLQPDYSHAIFRLGEEYFNNNDFGPALQWLPRVKRSDPDYWQSQFFAGLAAVHLGEYPRAVAFFREISNRLPMTEVLNNLGVALTHTNPAEAVTVLLRAQQQDVTDTDVHRNLAAAYLVAGDRGKALPLLHQIVHDQASPANAELLTIAQGTGAVDAASVLKTELLKSDFPADSFRQLEATIVQFDANKAQSLPDAKRLQFHLDQGRHLLEKGALDGSEKEFRAALDVQASSGPAHLGLAQVSLARHDWNTARREAQQSLQAGESADAHLVLVRVAIAQGQKNEAAHQLHQALQLDPDNSAALDLQKQLAGKP